MIGAVESLVSFAALETADDPGHAARSLDAACEIVMLCEDPVTAVPEKIPGTGCIDGIVDGPGGDADAAGVMKGQMKPQ